ncbi:cytochrome-c oxidase, cbb3-type subunit III [Ectothiorhodospira lacustris]|uniref:cytochrome-c oxidase, cbb3-type subunit III n=1 Tax=Ectothiorhodospira lacustris TaxID=2899127 RepID=UPI001EE84B67|nr:cytochrome-c oxidase, cbb3-type subunit III [Ectothiorhodospira lacustris]MCG5500377.1 cytochrome-c oxidase, cbb3-type subunit III [Ectothiorhodospira lacustris]MCG5509845.1 cytochrome-c oxidase, cbb3-type subunit III [Ectothiorhodospira lacustris]MCG5521098.1 cytochrome-c oxidase, cbb3-type subunit III [Ectothiorhodospira lacustris]
MNEPGHEQQSASGKPGGVKTTGHVWDDDLREYNNPLPRWWLWSFYATVVFSLIYWLLYPAWPIAGTYTKGISWINYEVEGEPQRSHWNSRALLVREMQTSDAAVRQREFLQVIAAADHDTVLSDTDMLAFVNSYARGIFGDFCAACHQTGGAGIIGLYPNLADDNWHWGGTIQAIEQTITRGRMGYMPPYRETFDDQQADAVAAYVLSLAGHEGGDPEQVSLGGSIYQGYEGGCYACHGREGLGLKSQGAPNLTNDIWQNIDVTGAQSHAERQALVRDLILRGVQREMPAFGDRLSPAEIRVLATYVHQLGGGL